MTRIHLGLQLGLRTAAAGVVAGSCLVLSAPVPAESATVLAPHRAVYDLKLARSTGKRSVEMVRGRILYDFTGSACEGYALQFRQVSEINSGEGKVALSDLQATTWEEGDGKSFRFNSQNRVNERVVDSVEGNAGRGGAGVAVTLSKPKQKNFDVDAKVAFPTEHMRRIIEAASGTTDDILKLTVWLKDGAHRKVLNQEWLKMFPDEKSRPARHTFTGEEMAGNMLIQAEFWAVLP